MNYKIITLEERYDLFQKQDDMAGAAWPEFMHHDPIANKNWMKFIEYCKDYQLMLMEGDEFLAVVNTVPLYFDKPVEDLPDTGWDWGLEKAVKDLEKGIKANMLLGLQIVVNPKYQGRGLSSLAVKEMAALAKRKGFDKLVIPVRPSDKYKSPLIPMNEYLTWKNEKDLPYDNWLRVHIKCGGTILKTCLHAMRIPGSIKDWQEWTGLDMPGSGEYIIPGALNPVTADIDKNEALYIEPNVWVLHKID
ncbi:MAG: GNAT family N-acetyltransferase [Spirochaetaceae bacterium]|jgi:GNAT superfamily N-acetyltransferase|nr:GNAT family N-acetyltransferase [Spirochaetaceae bacterium]